MFSFKVIERSNLNKARASISIIELYSPFESIKSIAIPYVKYFKLFNFIKSINYLFLLLFLRFGHDKNTAAIRLTRSISEKITHLKMDHEKVLRTPMFWSFK